MKKTILSLFFLIFAQTNAMEEKSIEQNSQNDPIGDDLRSEDEITQEEENDLSMLDDGKYF